MASDGTPSSVRSCLTRAHEGTRRGRLGGGVVIRGILYRSDHHCILPPNSVPKPTETSCPAACSCLLLRSLGKEEVALSSVGMELRVGIGEGVDVIP